MADVAIIQRFLPDTSRGGVGYFTDGLARTLVRRGHRVTVFSQDPAPADAPYQVTHVEVADRWWAPLAFPFAVRRCDLSGFDVIHAQGDDQWLRRRGRPPVIRTMHGTALAEAWFNGVRGRSLRRLLLHLWFFVGEWLAAVRADRLVGVSAHTLSFYPRVGQVIPNGIDVASLSQAQAAKATQPTVLFIGEVDSRKRGRLLIAAMRRVRQVLPAAELWVVGPEVAPEPGVRCWGRVDDATLRDVLRSAWVLCLPSAYEGFGRPYIEAMAAGTTVVASPNPGAREVLDDGALGVIAADDRLAEALIGILQSPERRAAIEHAASSAVVAYDWDVVATQYEALYAEVMTGVRAKA